MNKILLVGASGKVGFYLYNRLFQLRSFKVYTLSMNSSFQNNIFYNYAKDDLSTIKSLSLIEFDYVINCVGKLPSKSLKYSQYFDTNCLFIINLYKILKASPVFIQLSTISVYGESVFNRTITKHDNINPLNFYAKSKYFGESVIPCLFEKYHILRIPPIYTSLYDKTLYKRLICSPFFSFISNNGETSHSYCSLLNLYKYILKIVNNKLDYGLHIVCDDYVYSQNFLLKFKYGNNLLKFNLPFSHSIYTLIKPYIPFQIIKQFIFKFFYSNLYSNK